MVVDGVDDPRYFYSDVYAARQEFRRQYPKARYAYSTRSTCSYILFPDGKISSYDAVFVTPGYTEQAQQRSVDKITPQDPYRWNPEEELELQDFPGGQELVSAHIVHLINK